MTAPPITRSPGVTLLAKVQVFVVFEVGWHFCTKVKEIVGNPWFTTTLCVTCGAAA
jgi:hypothetical protein